MRGPSDEEIDCGAHRSNVRSYIDDICDEEEANDDERNPGRVETPHISGNSAPFLTRPIRALIS